MKTNRDNPDRLPSWTPGDIITADRMNGITDRVNAVSRGPLPGTSQVMPVASWPRMAVLTGHTQVGTVYQWTYAAGFATKSATGYGSTTMSTGDTFTCRNLCEFINATVTADTQAYGNGVLKGDLALGTGTETASLLPIVTGSPVWVSPLRVYDTSAGRTFEFWFDKPNALTVTCP